MTARARAFTLLEVMVALAILALGFGVIVEAHSRAAMATLDARAVTIGTLLARGKILDIEYELKKDGFGDSDKVIEGDFSEEGFPEYKWIATLRMIEIPVGKMEDFSTAMGTVSSLLGEGASTALGGGSEGGGAAAGALGMMGPILETAATVVNESVREFTLEVKLPEGGRLENIKVTTHLVDDVKLAAGLAKAGAGFGGAMNMASQAQQFLKGQGPGQQGSGPGNPPPGNPTRDLGDKGKLK